MIDIALLDERIDALVPARPVAPPSGRPAMRRAAVRPVVRVRVRHLGTKEVEKPASVPHLAADEAHELVRPDHSGLGVADHARRVRELMALGRIHEADSHIGAHALLTRNGPPADRFDAVTWATMRTLLDGRRDDARVGADLVLAIGREAGRPEAAAVHWAQRFWLALEWGDKGDHDDVLDHCRQRAYRNGEPAWRAALALLLARLHRFEEARWEFDAIAPRLGLGPDSSRRGPDPSRRGPDPSRRGPDPSRRGKDGQAIAGGPDLPGRGSPAWTDMATNLAAAAAVMGDRHRAATIHVALATQGPPMVMAGEAWVCKGAMARFRALTAPLTVAGASECDSAFREAVEVHRGAGALPLLARTLQEWASSLSGRDDLGARRCLAESETLTRELGLIGVGADPDAAPVVPRLLTAVGS